MGYSGRAQHCCCGADMFYPISHTFTETPEDKIKLDNQIPEKGL
jgi:hypothetical protein